jgi:hypothetical protein
MTFAEWVLIAVAAATLFNTGLQYYTTVSTYPLFSSLDFQNFLSFHKAYERKLPLSIYVPYTLHTEQLTPLIHSTCGSPSAIAHSDAAAKRLDYGY